MSAPTARDETAASLRVEHDDLARRLEIRPSIDELRRGLIRLFVGLIATGLTVKLGWDRWGVLKPGMVRKLHHGPPLFLWIATTVAWGVLFQDSQTRNASWFRPMDMFFMVVSIVWLAIPVGLALSALVRGFRALTTHEMAEQGG